MYKKQENFNFTQFMYVDKELNIIVDTKYFKKLKNYTEFIIYMVNLIDTTLTFNNKHFNNNTINVIINLLQYKIKELDLDFIKMIIVYFQDKYPDNLNKIYVKNATILIKGLYKILKPLICKETRDKIVFEKGNLLTEDEFEISKLLH